MTGWKPIPPICRSMLKRIPEQRPVGRAEEWVWISVRPSRYCAVSHNRHNFLRNWRLCGGRYDASDDFTSHVDGNTLARRNTLIIGRTVMRSNAGCKQLKRPTSYQSTSFQLLNQLQNKKTPKPTKSIRSKTRKLSGQEFVVRDFGLRRLATNDVAPDHYSIIGAYRIRLPRT